MDANNIVIWKDLSHEITEYDKPHIKEYIQGKYSNLDILIFVNSDNLYGINIVNTDRNEIVYNNHFSNLLDLLKELEVAKTFLPVTTPKEESKLVQGSPSKKWMLE